MKTIKMKQKIVVFGLLASLVSGAAVHDVRDYGAKGDGVAKDTAAIQKAVDAANASGGGEVRLSPGTYLSGTVYLKSRVTLKLDAGAVLKGSSDREDYCAPDAFPQNYASKADNTTGGHLLVCANATGVSIVGPGCIDGNGRSVILDKTGKRAKSKLEIAWRPGQMVYFVDSTDIRITDVELADSPYWSCFVLNCDRVFIRGCYVHTSRQPHTFNGDGIDIDRCRWVTISGCRIDTADDCITLRASSANRLKDPHDCAYVTVSDCNLSSSCNAIRPGVGEGVIRDSVFSNVIISDSRVAFNLSAAYSKGGRGTDLLGLRFENFRVDAKEFFRIHHMHSREATFDDIVFSGFSGTVKKPSVIRAHPAKPFKRIVFENIDLPCGFDSVNADVSVRGGTFSENRLTAEESAKISDDIVNGRCLQY